MADLTFRFGEAERVSSPRSQAEWVQAVRARDARIRDLEELLQEAQQVASVGRVEVNLEDTKSRVEIDYLRKRKQKLESQLLRLQEEFVSITLQFDAEMNELRARLQRGEEVIAKLASRQAVAVQTDDRRRGSHSYLIASQGKPRNRCHTLRTYCHHQRNERPRLALAENVARVNIRKLQLIPRPEEFCPRLSQSCVVTPLTRRVFPAVADSPRRAFPPAESPRRPPRKWEDDTPPLLRSRLHRFATPVILSPPHRRASPTSQSPFRQLRKLLR